MIRRFQAQKGFIVPLLTQKIYEFTPEFNVLFGQNGCLAEGTPIATPFGPVPIEKLQVGDLVFDENGKEIEVEAVLDQGIKEVVEIKHRGKVMAESTLDHKWIGREFRSKEYREISPKDFPLQTVLKRAEYTPRMGYRNEPKAYAVGVMLGSRFPSYRTDKMYLQNESAHVAEKVASVLNAEFRLVSDTESIWEFEAEHFDYYAEWCRGRIPKQKVLDLDIIKSWNRYSLLQFLAGVIDSAGTLYVEKDKPNTVIMGIGFTSKSVVEGVMWTLNALFGAKCQLSEDPRSGRGFFSGPYYFIRSSDHHTNIRILNEIGSKIRIPNRSIHAFNFPNRKRARKPYMYVTLGKKRKAHVWDIRVKSPTSLYLLANGLITHNCGKSSMLNTMKAYAGIAKGGWTQINDPRSHGAASPAHFPFAYTAYTPMPNMVHAFVERDKNPAFYFHGDTKIDLNFMWDTSRQSENGILSGMDNLELAAKKPSSGMLKIELINRIMAMLQNSPNLSVVPEWILQKESAMHEVNYIASLPNFGKITLLFDEPETALSIPKQTQLFDTLATLSKTFQVIIATHSPLVLFRNDINLIELTPGYADECVGIYKTAVKKMKK